VGQRFASTLRWFPLFCILEAVQLFVFFAVIGGYGGMSVPSEFET
jgi:hypothetical protein